MRNRFFLIVILGLFAYSGYAQDDAHLKMMTENVILLRESKSSINALNKVVINLSASGCPKMTLMDEIKRDEANEYRGNKANKFKMNQLVANVYNRQNTGMSSKGDYFNSTEKDVFYSAIEKNVKKGCSVAYSLTGHVGQQEFVFVAFNPKTRFTATVNGQAATAKGEGVQVIKLGKVKKEDVITLSISNESSENESFVILNHNPQK